MSGRVLHSLLGENTTILQDPSPGEGLGCTRQFSDTPCGGDRPTCPSASDFWRVLGWCYRSAGGDGGGGDKALPRGDSDRAGEVMSEPQQRQGAERDLYRDTWVRYLGYANEVGEAFRSLVPAAVVWLSYGVSGSYVLADALDKGKKAGEVPSPEAGGRSSRMALAVVDTFVWQSLASVAIPGFTINRLCAASLYVLGTMTRWPLTVRKWTTTTLGLLAIPVIVHPIDRSVDFLLDSSLRKLYPSMGKPSSS